MSIALPLADVAYVEPWWMQILKSIVIFLVGLQILPAAMTLGASPVPAVSERTNRYTDMCVTPSCSRSDSHGGERWRMGLPYDRG